MSPNGTPVPGTPAVQQMLPPPPPLSGRSAPYPLNTPGRIPVTPPAIAGMPMAGQVPVGDTESDDFMDIGEPDNPMAITELVTHLTETSNTTRRQ
eukprot:10279835-Prorocentrum_lima.AAC.1